MVHCSHEHFVCLYIKSTLHPITSAAAFTSASPLSASSATTSALSYSAAIHIAVCPPCSPKNQFGDDDFNQWHAMQFHVYKLGGPIAVARNNKIITAARTFKTVPTTFILPFRDHRVQERLFTVDNLHFSAIQRPPSPGVPKFPQCPRIPDRQHRIEPSAHPASK